MAVAGARTGARPAGPSLVRARYTYTWLAGDDPTATSIVGEDTETTEVVVYDSRVRFKNLKGQVEVCHPIGYADDGTPIWDSPKKWERADRNTRVLVGTKIRVPFGGSARLEHPYGWKVTLTSETMITVPRVYSEESILPDTGLVDTLEFFGLDYGLANVDIVTRDDTSVAITMKKAVVRVKGTQFVLVEDEATSTVKVLDGTVEVESLVDGAIDLVESGEMIAATSDGLGEREVFDVVAEAVLVGGGLLAVLLVKYRRGRRTYGQPPYACRSRGAPSPSGTAFCKKCGARLGG